MYFIAQFTQKWQKKGYSEFIEQPIFQNLKIHWNGQTYFLLKKNIFFIHQMFVNVNVFYTELFYRNSLLKLQITIVKKKLN